jgi:hypothetical protein
MLILFMVLPFFYLLINLCFLKLQVTYFYFSRAYLFFPSTKMKKERIKTFLSLLENHGVLLGFFFLPWSD